VDRSIRTASWILGAIVALAPMTVSATAQHPERLIYKGKTLPLYAEPLERRFSQGPATYWNEPAFGPPKRRPKVFRASSTACWRGYQGTWKVDKGFLWLAALHKCPSFDGKSKPIPIASVLAGEKLPLKAIWYSGVLRVPLGKRLQYVHMGFMSTYEQDLFIAVRHGEVAGEKKVDNRDPDAVRRGSGFRQRPSKSELARALMSVRRGLQRCARKGKQRDTVEVEIQPDGSVNGIKLGRQLSGTPPGRCLFAVLARARYPEFFGPPVRSRHQLP